MRPVSGRLVAMVGAVLGLLATTLPAVPAQAAVAPWTWKRVVVPVSVQPATSYSVRATCPAGFTAITGGLELPLFSTLRTQAQYRQDDVSGSGWSVIFRNNSTSSGTASVVAECVETADLPPISYASQNFSRDGNGQAAGEVACPNPGEAVLTGGADWSNTSTGRAVWNSVPGAGETSWYATGSNPVAGAQLTVEVYCVDPANTPGYQTVSRTNSGTDWTTNTVTCPSGKRILNGGTLSQAYASYPTFTTWTSTTWLAGTTTRAICISAGVPTVSITSASPGSGTVSTQASASFTLAGSDPAGYPNDFRCSLDGSAPVPCSSSPSYQNLTTGTHQFVVWNSTPDGRTSLLISHSWTVDRTGPTVTTPSLPRTTLSGSARATWTASDAFSGVDFYQAAYRILGVDGSASAWTRPDAWAGLTSPTVQTPTITRGQSLCLSVRAGDGLGNLSAWSPASCTTRPFDDRDMTTTAGWTRVTGSSYWLSTATTTSASAQTLTRTNVSLSRVGLVATSCSGCGTVAVSVGGVQIGQVNLDAASTSNRRVILLPAFTQQTGNVTVRSVTSGKPITIDGLVAIQRTSTVPSF